jgi:hypothetical protein
VITIKTTGFKEVRGYLDALAKDQLPFALSKGLNDTANRVKAKEVELMKQVFDRPTPFTLNSLQVIPAKKDRLVAEIRFRDPAGMVGKQHYLAAEIQGGNRQLKPFEQLLGGRDLMPGKGLDLNKYGNIPRAQIVQILAVLQQVGESGMSTALHNKISNLKNTKDLFLVTQKTGGLVPGIYLRIPNGDAVRKKGQGIHQKGMAKGKFYSAIRPRGVKPLLIFGRAPQYKDRFKFYETGQQTVDESFKQLFGDAIQLALKTARSGR